MDGRRARRIVHALHHWLDQRRLLRVSQRPIIEQFFAGREPAIPKITSWGTASWSHLRAAHDRALIGFDPDICRPPHHPS
jgi:hypothetical protein